MMNGSSCQFQSEYTNKNPYNNQPTFGGNSPFNRPAASYIILIGEEVIIRDIKSRPYLNGQIGIIEEYDNRKQRYLVNVENEKLYLNQDNILCVTNITYCQTNHQGKIINYNNNKYTLLLKTTTKSVKVRNVTMTEFIINDVSVVKLVNIKNQPYLNGEYVKIEKYDPKTERYVVKRSNGYSLKVKKSNIWI